MWRATSDNYQVNLIISYLWALGSQSMHGPLSKRRGSEKKAYLGEMKAWLGSIVDICTSMCAYNMCYSGK